jgi:endonuclease V-like protein UPF0215 family
MIMSLYLPMHENDKDIVSVKVVSDEFGLPVVCCGEHRPEGKQLRGATRVKTINRLTQNPFK